MSGRGFDSLRLHQYIFWWLNTIIFTDLPNVVSPFLHLIIYIHCDKAMPSGMWSNPTAVYRLIGCHLGSTRIRKTAWNSGKTTFRIRRRRTCIEVQDIVSAMTKAWNSTSHRLHQIHIWWFLFCLFLY